MKKKRKTRDDSAQKIPKSARNKSKDPSVEYDSVLASSPKAGKIRPRKSKLKDQIARQEKQKSINEAHDAQLDDSDHKRSGLKLPRIPSSLRGKDESPES